VPGFFFVAVLLVALFLGSVFDFALEDFLEEDGGFEA
jgi:hypothetical protein